MYKDNRFGTEETTGPAGPEVGSVESRVESRLVLSSYSSGRRLRLVSASTRSEIQ